MKNLSTTVLRYKFRVLIFELGLAITVGVILFLREHTLDSFGDWMFWAGLIVLVIGASSIIGGWGITRSGLYQMGQTVSEQDVSTRTKADLREEEANFSFLQLAAGVGILAIVISALT